MFASDFQHEIAMEDALHEINEILERKNITDQHKAMILGVNAKRFYNLYLGDFANLVARTTVSGVRLLATVAETS